jgi:iron complex outermembrane receptor protein
MMRILPAAIAAAFLSHAAPCLAQRVDDNAVTEAEDAFGTSIGSETIGIYSARSVRGFSPVQAGNVRIEGLYFDRQGALPPRLMEGSTVRVGLSAQSYLFPAPTGIVDYRLQKVGDKRVSSLAVTAGPYDGGSVEADVRLPFADARFGVATGVSYSQEEYYDGSDAPFLRAAVVPRWRPTEDIDVLAFASVSRGRDEEAPPAIRTAGSFLPPRVERRRYFGQTWADGETESLNYGVLAKARMGRDWAFAGGLFHSSFERLQGFAEQFVGTTREGLTRETVIADPSQRYASTSGELRLSRSIVEGPRLHVLHASLRGRRLHSRYGGSATPLVLPERRLGEILRVPRPEFAFRERTRDLVEQRTLGLAYEGRWREVGEWSVGVQKTDYEKRIEPPGAAPTATTDDPWLVNATASWFATDRLAVYAGHTRGLEESGLAPADVANRNEALPAIRTRQTDAGIRWQIGRSMKLVAGLFDVRKPYFITDDANVLRVQGDVRHRGLELSFSGKPREDLSVIVGAVLMDPEVTGVAVREGRIGDKPVGQSDRTFRTDLEYRPPTLHGWSFDFAATHVGDRTASRDGRSEVPAYTMLDLGARYRFALGRHKAMLRLQALNLTDAWTWNIYGSNSFGLTDGRRFQAQLAIDFDGP